MTPTPAEIQAGRVPTLEEVIADARESARESDVPEDSYAFRCGVLGFRYRQLRTEFLNLLAERNKS